MTFKDDKFLCLFQSKVRLRDCSYCASACALAEGETKAKTGATCEDRDGDGDLACHCLYV